MHVGTDRQLGHVVNQHSSQNQRACVGPKYFKYGRCCNKAQNSETVSLPHAAAEARSSRSSLWEILPQSSFICDHQTVISSSLSPSECFLVRHGVWLDRRTDRSTAARGQIYGRQRRIMCPESTAKCGSSFSSGLKCYPLLHLPV